MTLPEKTGWYLGPGKMPASYNVSSIIQKSGSSTRGNTMTPDELERLSTQVNLAKNLRAEILELTRFIEYLRKAIRIDLEGHNGTIASYTDSSDIAYFTDGKLVEQCKKQILRVLTGSLDEMNIIFSKISISAESEG